VTHIKVQIQAAGAISEWGTYISKARAFGLLVTMQVTVTS
jgi:hypothetical protein